METTYSNANGSGTEGTWEKLKSSLLKAPENGPRADLPRNTGDGKRHGGGMRLSTVQSRKSRDAGKPGRKEEYQKAKEEYQKAKEQYRKAKRLAKNAVYLAKSQAKQEIFKDPSPSSSDLFRLASLRQQRCENLDVQGDKAVRSDAGELCLDDRAKRAAWQEHCEHLSNVEFDWDPDSHMKSILWMTRPPTSHLSWRTRQLRGLSKVIIEASNC